MNVVIRRQTARIRDAATKRLTPAPAPAHFSRRTTPRPPPHISHQSRCMVSIPQIMFDATRPHVSIPSTAGPLHRNIRPSFPKNAHKVVTELNALFAEQAPHPGSSGGWTLDTSCDAISAFFVLPSREDVAAMLTRVLAAAETLNHHPALSVAERGGEGSWVLLATCATHRPAGLSVKDARLARCINESAGEVARPLHAGEGGVEALQEWHWRENMGRARVRLDVDVVEGDAEGGGEGSRSGGEGWGRCWRVNTAEDVEAFVKGEEKGGSHDVPVLRGLIP